MNRMSHPFLQDYYDQVAQCLLQRAFSLGQFQVNPPEQIFVMLEELPQPLKDLQNGQNWQCRKLIMSNNHNVRIFYLILLKLCFTGEQSFTYLKKVLKLIFDNRFDIKFPLNRNSDPKLFNSNQFKKLFVDILYHLDMQQFPNIEQTIGKYPLIDIVIIYIMRSLLTMKGHVFDYGTDIPNSVVFQELCSYFEISYFQQGKRHIINKNFVVSQQSPSFLIVAYKQPKTGTDTQRSSVSKIYAIDNDQDDIRESKYKNLPTHSNMVKNISFAANTAQFGSKNLYDCNMFQSQVIPLDHMTQSKFKNHFEFPDRDSVKTPISKVSSPNKKINYADEIRKSTIRVSMLKQNTNNKAKQKVNTQNIFCRESYFGGGNRQNLVKSSINPSSYQLSALTSNFCPYNSGISPNKFNDKAQNIKPSYFSQFAQPQNNNDPISTLGPKPKQSTQTSYYKDFTNSFLLQQLPQITKSSIKTIKKNFMKERSNIRSF